MLKSGDVIPADVLIVGIGERKNVFIIILMSLLHFSARSLFFTNTVKCLIMNL